MSSLYPRFCTGGLQSWKVLDFKPSSFNAWKVLNPVLFCTVKCFVRTGLNLFDTGSLNNAFKSKKKDNALVGEIGQTLLDRVSFAISNNVTVAK